MLSGSITELIQKEQELIAFTGNLTIGDAIDVMSHYEIFSAPVLSSKGCYVGSVDLLDLLCQLVQLTQQDVPVSPPTLSVHKEELEALTRRANDWNLQELINCGCIKVTKKEPFFYASPKTTVLEACGHFGRAVHHLLVVDNEGKVSNMVSQTEMIKHLSTVIDTLGAVGSKKVSELGLGTREVFAVRNTDAALDSFYELYTHGYSGGAIINAEGKLVGNLSRQDLKGTQAGTGFGVLAQSIMHYQRKHRVALAQRLVTVTPEHSLQDVIATMAREKVHRVFVISNGMFPRGLITQSDVCRVVYQQLSRERTLTNKQANKLMRSHLERPLSFPLVFPPE